MIYILCNEQKDAVTIAHKLCLTTEEYSKLDLFSEARKLVRPVVVVSRRCPLLYQITGWVAFRDCTKPIIIQEDLLCGYS